MIGQRLGNFRIERLLGQGGMARVYYGWDENLERPVAIKVLDTRFRENPAYARRFVQEARAVANWRHENIVQVYYAGEEDDIYFFAMEYVEGADLGRLLAEYAAAGELIPHDELLRIGRAIAAALDYAHQRQVIHRDVKPSNVLIAPEGRVLLADFGLALDVQKGTMGETFGTPHYIAPEQARNSSEAVTASDLYSLGVILFEMLTGVVPFDDPSPTSVALQHLTMAPPPPRALNPDLNQATEDALLRALAKDPADRYQSGIALITAVEAALQAPTEPGAPQWKLPPLPAGVEAPQRALSQLTIADRLSMLEPATAPAAPLPTPLSPTRAEPGTGFLQPLLIISALTVLLFALFFLMDRLQDGAPSVTTTSPGVAVLTVDSATVTAPPGTTVAPAEAGETPTPEEPVLATATIAATLTAFPATATVTPAPTPTNSEASAAPTVAFPNGQRVRMLYDGDSFYIWNPGSERIPFAPLSFEALGTGGQPIGYRFDGSAWAATGFNALTSNGCAGLKAFEASENPPSQCLQLNSLRTPTMAQLEAETGFWFSRPNVELFRVLWESNEVARCETGAEACEILLPLP